MAPLFALNPSLAESQKNNEKPPKNANINPPAGMATLQDNSQSPSQAKSQPKKVERPEIDGGSPYSQHYQPTAAIWGLYLKETEADDKELVDLWKTGLDQLLIFAGLFGAILTAFLIESRKDLKEDPLLEILQALRNNSSTSTLEPFRPPTFSLAVNAAWFSSLGLTLFSALAAVLAKGWLAKYTPASPGIHSKDACERYLRYLRAQQWRLGAIVGGIPLLIETALLLFSVGLVILTFNDNLGIGIGVLVLTMLATALYSFSTILPWFSPACPFQTTMSALIPCVANNRRYDDSGFGTEQHTTPEPPDSSISGTKAKPLSLGEKIFLQWNYIVVFAKETHRRPERLEIEAKILAWMLTKSTNESGIEEAVKAVAGANPSPQIRDVLLSSGASKVLCERFTRYFRIPPGLTTSAEDALRAEVYLYAMLRIVEPFDVEPSGKEYQDNYQFMHDSLLQLGQPLHRWDDFLDFLQPLACALRTKIFLLTRHDDHTDQWKRTKDNLLNMAGTSTTPNIRRVLVTTTVEGLLGGDTQLRKTCALILCRQFNFRDSRNVVVKTGRLEDVMKVMAELLKDEDTSEFFLRGATNLTKYAEFRAAIATTVPQIIAFFPTEGYAFTRTAVTDLLTQLSEHDIRESIGAIIPKISALLRESNIESRVNAADALAKLSEQVDFRQSIGASIPQIIALFNEHDHISSLGNSLLKLSEHAEYRDPIMPIIPLLVALIKLGKQPFSSEAADILAKLSEHADFRVAIGDAIPDIITFFRDSGSNSYYEHAESVVKLSERAEFRKYIGPAIPRIIALLSEKKSFIRWIGTNSLTKLSTYAQFRESIGTSIPLMIPLLSDSDPSIRGVSARSLAQFSQHAYFRELMKDTIPQMIALLGDTSGDAQRAAADFLANLSEQAEFRECIGASIPLIVALLDSRDAQSCRAGADALSKLSQHADFRESIGDTLPQIISLLSDSNYYARKAGADSLVILSEQVEFRECIGAAIPQIVTLLGENEPYSRRAGADCLATLSDYAQFKVSIGEAITRTITMPEKPIQLSGSVRGRIPNTTQHKTYDSSLAFSLPANGISHLLSSWAIATRFENIRDSRLLSRLSEFAQVCDSRMISPFSKVFQQSSELLATLADGKSSPFRRAVGATIPHIIGFLSDGDTDYRHASVNLLAKLSKQAEFRGSIGTVIPQIISLLSDSNRVTRLAGANALAKLSEQVELRESIRINIPQIISLIGNSNRNTFVAGINVLAKLSKQAEFRESIGAIIPQIISLLNDRNNDIRLSSANALAELSKQAEFRGHIVAVIPHVTSLLCDSDWAARRAGTFVFRRLLEQDEFLESIGAMIPQIISLLSKKHWDARLLGAKVLAKLSKQAHFRESIGAAVPQIISLLNGSDTNARRISAQLLGELSEHAEFRLFIGDVIPQIVSLLNNEDMDDRRHGAYSLAKLSAQAEFRESINVAIPLLVDLLSYGAEPPEPMFDLHIREQDKYAITPAMLTGDRDRDESARTAGINTLAIFSENAEFRTSIGVVIPHFITLLKDSNGSSRWAGINALLKFSVQAEFRDSIGTAIPDIIALLCDGKVKVRLAAVDALAQLSEHAEFRRLIETSIPLIIAMLSDNNSYPCMAAAYSLAKLSEKVEFRDSLHAAIPQIVTLLLNTRKTIREAAAIALSKLATNADLCRSIKASNLRHLFPVVLQDTAIDVVSSCAHIFAQLVIHGYLDDMIVKIVTFALDSLYSEVPDRQERGISVIAALANYARFKPILHEIWAIYSFTQHFLSNISLDQTRVLVEKMDYYGVLKTL